MKKHYSLLLVLGMIFSLCTSGAAQTNHMTERMVQEVSKTRLTNYVQTLQDFQTRYTYTQGNTDAGDWLYDFFDSLGLEVGRHQFTYSSHTEENIIARIQGSSYPDEIVAISGHFDATSNDPYNLAPGADDDASGIAAVLEAALILKDYRFQRTIEFWCYNAEEQGRRGSQAIANDYYAAGKNIVAVVNNDMIGYWPTGWERDLDVAYEPVSEWLADYIISICQRYVDIPIAKHPSGVCRDDHVSFTALGYSAVTNMDCWEAHNIGGETTPHYHRTTDTLETLNMDCMTQAVQVNIATVADLAGPIRPTTDIFNFHFQPEAIKP
jgi:leucyl aminopeptidase